MDEGKLLSPQEQRVLQDLEKIKRSVDAAGFHFGPTPQPEGVGVPQCESSASSRVRKLLQRYFGPLSSAAAACGRSMLLYFRNLGRAIRDVGAEATSTPYQITNTPNQILQTQLCFLSKTSKRSVEATQEQEDVPLRENDGNVSHQLRQHSAGGSRQSAVSNVPFEGVEAKQISAVGSQQSAVPVQISILGGLFTAAGAIITVNISRPRSDPVVARVLGLVAIGFAVGALLATAYCIIIIWVRTLQDAIAAAARPAPGYPYSMLNWLFYIGGILWAISLLVTLAAHTV